MKKYLALLLVISTVFLAVSCIAENNSSAPEGSDVSVPNESSRPQKEEDEYSPEESFDVFIKEDGTCAISSYKGNDPIVKVPKTINGVEVTEIGPHGLTSSKIQVVYLPEGVEKIGSYSLSNKNLEKVVLPEGLTAIGEGAFSGCAALKEITLPSTLVNIGNSAFTDCRSLKTIEIPSSVKSIGMEAFICSGLESVIFNEGLEIIGSNAFAACPLTEITLPASVKELGSGAFKQCDKLAKITLNEGLETIRYQAFDGTNIAEIAIPSTVTAMGERAFQGCTSVKKVYFNGNAPENYSTAETQKYMLNEEYIVYYREGAEGFTYPEWYGYTCRKVGVQAAVPDENDAPSNTGKADFDIKITVSDSIDEIPDYVNFFDDTGYFSQNWKIAIDVSDNIKSFSFIELDEAVALKVVKTIYVHHAGEYDEPLMIHTYLNDFSRNRGLSYVTGDGEVIYMGFACDMSGLSGEPAGYQDDLGNVLGRIPNGTYEPTVTDKAYKWEGNDIFEKYYNDYAYNEHKDSWTHIGVSVGEYVSPDKNEYSQFDIYRVDYTGEDWVEYYAVPYGESQIEAVYKFQFDDTMVPVWIKPQA